MHANLSGKPPGASTHFCSSRALCRAWVGTLGPKPTCTQITPAGPQQAGRQARHLQDQGQGLQSPHTGGPAAGRPLGWPFAGSVLGLGFACAACCFTKPGPSACVSRMSACGTFTSTSTARTEPAHALALLPNPHTLLQAPSRGRQARSQPARSRAALRMPFGAGAPAHAEEPWLSTWAKLVESRG